LSAIQEGTRPLHIIIGLFFSVIITFLSAVLGCELSFLVTSQGFVLTFDAASSSAALLLFLYTTEGTFLLRAAFLVAAYYLIIKPEVSEKIKTMPTDRFISIRDLSVIGQRGRFTNIQLAPY
jgi:hypothetical protein